MLTQLTDNLYCIEVPIDANQFIIFSSSIEYIINGNGDDETGGDLKNIQLTQGEWELIGTVDKDECSFDCEPYVEKIERVYGKSYYDYIKPCENGTYQYVGTKEDSFRSLIESKMKGKTWVNPLGEYKPQRLAVDNEELPTLNWHQEKWQQAEQNLLTKVVILKKK